MSHRFRKKWSKSKRLEFAISWIFRLATYFILLCVTYIFADIVWNGAKVLFQAQAPFINIDFLTQAPETLHVFEYQGQEYEMGDSEYRRFLTENGLEAIEGGKTYAHSAGGIMPAIVGTITLVTGSMVIALFLGVISATFLSEYSKRSPFIDAIRLAIINLAGVPSIVFGLFGMAMFVNYGPVFAQDGIREMETMFGLGIVPVFPYDANNAFMSIPLYFNDYYLSLQGWGVSMIAGWFTLSIMVLPIIITASEESLRAVPQGFREGSLALGATKWKMIRTNVLPYALPGILTSSILGITRVAGETAPIMFTAAFVIREELPWEVDNLAEFFFQGVMALPYHIYVVSTKVPQNIYTEKAQYAACFVFLALVFFFTLSSILLRIKVREKIKW
jgi:phosphate transport system permease protein